MKTWRNRRAERALLAGIRAGKPDRERPEDHLSTYLYCLRKARHRLDHPELWAEDGPYRDPDSLTLKFFFGESSHSTLGGGTHADKTEEVDGFLFTPDDVKHEDGVALVVEIKTTRAGPTVRVGEQVNPKTKRTNGIYVDKEVESFPSYVEQAAGYCVFKRTNRARIVVFFLIQAELRIFDVEFSEIELQGWRRELEKRRRVLKQAPTWESIGFEYAWKWECEECPLHVDGSCPGGGQKLAAFSYAVKDVVAEFACV